MTTFRLEIEVEQVRVLINPKTGRKDLETFFELFLCFFYESHTR